MDTCPTLPQPTEPINKAKRKPFFITAQKPSKRNSSPKLFFTTDQALGQVLPLICGDEMRIKNRIG